MASMQYFYHYTSTAGANSIRNDGIIRSQNAIILSTLKPEDYIRADILKSIYGNKVPPELKNGADNVVYVPESSLDSSKLFPISSTLYRYSGEITVSADNVKDKPKCLSYSSSSGWNGSSGSQRNPQEFYYYTNQHNATTIMHSKCIPYDYRSKVYLTKMNPEDYYRDEILNTIYGRDYDRKQYASCADWCIKIDGTQLDDSKMKQNGKLFEYTNSIRIDPSDVMDKPQCRKAGKRSDYAQQEYLYHYTDTTGAQAIKACGYLKISGASGAFGAGVYMTNLKPTDFFRDDILKNNYGGINSAFKGRADWVVRVKKSSLNNSKLKSVASNVTRDASRQIFVYEEVVYVQSADVYNKPKCYRAE